MTLRRASLILPCRRLDELPTHASGRDAADLLAAWTALWHPALLHLTGQLPGWHPADDPPDPAALEGELVLVPTVGRRRLAGDWCDRLRATAPRNPTPVEALPSRRETAAAALAAAGIPRDQAAAVVADDFYALGYAHLQVELLTRAMRYTPVLDDEQFSGAVIAAAHAAVNDDRRLATEEIGRAFDLLADARNHVYAVDFYVIDATLLAPSTLGDPLRRKLAAGFPTNLLASGELIERLAREEPDSMKELSSAAAAGTVCLIGGAYHNGSCGGRSPESILTELHRGQETIRRHVGRECEVFGQFSSSFSPLLPEILAGLGFRGALHAAFDGGRLPRADQCKTRWGNSDGAWIEALSTMPLDAAKPESWLTLAERIGDSIAHDHVATVLLAGWPGQSGEFFGDLCRAAHYNSVLGKLVTLDEYFRVSRETDDWTSFHPRDYTGKFAGDAIDPISASVGAYRRDVLECHGRLSAGLQAIVPGGTSDVSTASTKCSVILNPWSFPSTAFVGADPVELGNSARVAQDAQVFRDIPGCGYQLRKDDSPPGATVSLVDGHLLRNELLELNVSDETGGIRSLRTHRDRSTRLSQRLVFQAGGIHSQMIAERIETTRDDGVVGEIAAHGRLLDAAGDSLARFTQSVRLARGLPVAIVDVQIELQRQLTGDAWTTYIASRLAWPDEAATFRRGDQWLARETSHERIESPEWVEAANGEESIVCFALGLPFHRQAGPAWLDTLLVTERETTRRFQFGVALDCRYPTQQALALMTAGSPTFVDLPQRPDTSSGWFLHVGARNVIVTHVEPLATPAAGIRCRLLETEGRAVETTLAAFRPFRAARITDFRGNTNEVLSVAGDQVHLDIGPHRWIQLEAEW